MTVKELIDLLAKHDGSKQVVVVYDGGYGRSDPESVTAAKEHGKDIVEIRIG